MRVKRRDTHREKSIGLRGHPPWPKIYFPTFGGNRPKVFFCLLTESPTPLRSPYFFSYRSRILKRGASVAAGANVSILKERIA